MYDAFLDGFEWLLTSPAGLRLVMGGLLVVLAVLVVQAVRVELAYFAFMRRHGFRHSPTASTMWLARAVEYLDAANVYGWWDGLHVTLRKQRRRGLTIVVTAERDLVSAADGRRVSLGAWTRPEPPSMFRGMTMEASGRELCLHVGTASDLERHIPAAVAYARALQAQPVDPDRGRTFV